MIDNFSKVYASVEDLVVRRMHIDLDWLLFKFDERILVFLKSDSFYLPSAKNTKNGGESILSYDVASGSEITPCNKVDKPLVVYRFTGNVMTSIITLRS